MAAALEVQDGVPLLAPPGDPSAFVGRPVVPHQQFRSPHVRAETLPMACWRKRPASGRTMTTETNVFSFIRRLFAALRGRLTARSESLPQPTRTADGLPRLAVRGISRLCGKP